MRNLDREVLFLTTRILDCHPWGMPCLISHSRNVLPSKECHAKPEVCVDGVGALDRPCPTSVHDLVHPETPSIQRFLPLLDRLDIV